MHSNEHEASSIWRDAVSITSLMAVRCLGGKNPPESAVFMLKKQSSATGKCIFLATSSSRTGAAESKKRSSIAYFTRHQLVGETIQMDVEKAVSKGKKGGKI